MTLFRYPGGKSKLVKNFVHLFPLDAERFIEPFVGGGNVFLHTLLKTNHPYKSYVINDIEPRMAAFWRVMFGKSDADFTALVQRMDVTPTVPMFQELREVNLNAASEVEKAFHAMFFTRCTHGSIMSAQPIGGWNQDTAAAKGDKGYSKEVEPVACRYNAPRLIKEMQAVRALAAKVKVMEGDYQAVLDLATPADFVYLDPPYVKAGKQLYTDPSQMMDHTRLRNSLVQLNVAGVPWLISYDEHPTVRALYKDVPDIQFEGFDATYTMDGKKKTNKVGKELLVYNYNYVSE